MVLIETNWLREVEIWHCTCLLCIELYSCRQHVFTKSHFAKSIRLTKRLSAFTHSSNDDDSSHSKEELPPYYQPWMEIAMRVPELVHSHKLRPLINKVSGDNKLTRTVHYVYGAMVQCCYSPLSRCHCWAASFCRDTESYGWPTWPSVLWPWATSGRRERMTQLRYRYFFFLLYLLYPSLIHWAHQTHFSVNITYFAYTVVKSLEKDWIAQCLRSCTFFGHECLVDCLSLRDSWSQFSVDESQMGDQEIYSFEILSSHPRAVHFDCFANTFPNV